MIIYWNEAVEKQSPGISTNQKSVSKMIVNKAYKVDEIYLLLLRLDIIIGIISW